MKDSKNSFEEIKNSIIEIPILGDILLRLYYILFAKDEILKLKRERDSLERRCSQYETVFSKVLGKEISDKKAVFIHSLWRSGSTYIWSKFQNTDKYTCYYEPLHEDLLKKSKTDIEETHNLDRMIKLKHDTNSKNYFSEIPLSEEKGVPFFKKEFPYDSFLHEDCNSQLKNYINFLIFSAKKPPIFQFCRSALRSKWFKENYKSLNIFIVRSPRHQWESFLRTDSYFICCLFLVAGKLKNKKIFQSLTEEVEIPEFHSDDIGKEFIYYQDFIKKVSNSDKYLVFYYFWLLSFLLSGSISDIIIDIDYISSDKKAREFLENKLEAEIGHKIDFKDCNVKRYNNFNLQEESFRSIEENTKGTVLNIADNFYTDKLRKLLTESKVVNPAYISISKE